MAIAPSPSIWLFAQLKMRIIANGLRGRASRTALFVLGVIGALYLAAVGFLLFAASAAGEPHVRLMAASYGGAVLVIASVLLPLVWFGVDDTLDPARMALLPLGRGLLVTGLLVGALVSVPTVALLLGTAGLLVPAAVHGNWLAVLGQAVGLLAGLLLCVTAGRAITSAFATMLRSRRVRDLAGIMLATLTALIVPIQLMVVSATQNADWEQLTTIARIIGWTPLAAPYTLGYDLAEGAPVPAAAKLAITAAAIAGMLWWWSRSVESAMAGAASSGGSTRRTGPNHSSPVSLLFPRGWCLPHTAFGAVAARELRYWWRDARRRANLITIAVIGVFLPVGFVTGGVIITFGDPATSSAEFTATPILISFITLFVGTFAASVLANQFGFDGTAYATQLTAGVPGRRELAARATAYSSYLLPVLIVIGAVLALALGDGALAPAAWGMLFAGYGTGLAINTLISVVGAYPLPESSNPFAIQTGSGLAKSLLALLGIVGAFAAAAPVLVAAELAGDIWVWLALPVGLGYGAGAVWLGVFLVGDLLDRRAPELLATITPRR